MRWTTKSKNPGRIVSDSEVIQHPTAPCFKFGGVCVVEPTN